MVKGKIVLDSPQAQVLIYSFLVARRGVDCKPFWRELLLLRAACSMFVRMTKSALACNLKQHFASNPRVIFSFSLPILEADRAADRGNFLQGDGIQNFPLFDPKRFKNGSSG